MTRGKRELLQWARMRASGESIRSFCLESGRKRSTFYYWRKRALDKVAATLNEERAARDALPLTRRLPLSQPPA